jgi:hypothetical protein
MPNDPLTVQCAMCGEPCIASDVLVSATCKQCTTQLMLALWSRLVEIRRGLGESEHASLHADLLAEG